VLIENSFNTGTNAVWTDAQSLYQTHTLIALESLARGPDVEALLNFAASSGVLVQLEPTPCLAIWATIRLAAPLAMIMSLVGREMMPFSAKWAQTRCAEMQAMTRFMAGVKTIFYMAGPKMMRFGAMRAMIGYGAIAA
jgi:hypothetical protein